MTPFRIDLSTHLEYMTKIIRSQNVPKLYELIFRLGRETDSDQTLRPNDVRNILGKTAGKQQQCYSKPENNQNTLLFETLEKCHLLFAMLLWSMLRSMIFQ